MTTAKLKPERRLHRLNFTLDANCVNARGQDPALNQLQKWKDDGLITILASETAQKEMAAGGNDTRTAKASEYVFTESAVSTDIELRLLAQVKSILFPRGVTNQNQRNDVEVVFNAGKYGRILVTNDGASASQPGGILGNRRQLAQIEIVAMPPEEAVALVNREIVVRDNLARQWAARSAAPLPAWVGKDGA